MNHMVGKECNRINTGQEWCQPCSALHFEENFPNWTSGNVEVDRCIQKIQLSAKDKSKTIEWISYDKFREIQYITKGGFSDVYRAIWPDGNIERWDIENQRWKRYKENQYVALKRYRKSDVTRELFQEVFLMFFLKSILYLYIHVIFMFLFLDFITQ